MKCISYILIIFVFIILGCESEDNVTERTGQINKNTSNRNQSKLNMELNEISHYLIDNIGPANKYAASEYPNTLFIMLKEKTYNNPIDTKILADSINAIIERNLPINNYTVKIICGYYNITISEFYIKDTIIKYDYNFNRAKTEEEERRRTEWKYLNCIKVKNIDICKGDLADDVFNILKPINRISEPTVSNYDPQDTKVTQHYKIDGRYIDITFKRFDNQGPYIVTNIRTRID